MREWLTAATEAAILLIDGLALLVVAAGTLQAFAGAVREMLAPRPGQARREVWLRYGRWLVAGLTFQLAADIVETSITTQWDAVARLAAIAVIRTFLNYFLERDLAEAREREETPRAAGAERLA